MRTSPADVGGEDGCGPNAGGCAMNEGPKITLKTREACCCKKTARGFQSSSR